MAHTTTHDPNLYYVPHGTKWPIVGSFALFFTVFGAANWMNGHVGIGKGLMVLGLALLVVMLFGWFGTVIRESIAGFYNRKVDISFRMGMMWFIFSEVMFFAAFFGALFYARQFSVPWLGGEGVKIDHLGIRALYNHEIDDDGLTEVTASRIPHNDVHGISPSSRDIDLVREVGSSLGVMCKDDVPVGRYVAAIIQCERHRCP